MGWWSSRSVVARARERGATKSIFKRHDPPHRARNELSSRHPVHVTLRTRKEVPRLRQRRAYKATRRVLARYLGSADFRVVHLSIQHNHFHFLIEARNKRALTRGMQSLTINLARAINCELGREGKVFEYRYHDRQITSARQVRNALAYVLNNWRRHREDLQSPRAMTALLDPYASGLSFTGWCREGSKGSPRFTIPPGYVPLPVSPPTTDLLRHGWSRFGPIDLFETPGPLR
jgi:REP element-mobilizing transposase RayT